jgi:MFS transporter, DHA1 family, inner membrane transport protein
MGVVYAGQPMSSRSSTMPSAASIPGRGGRVPLVVLTLGKFLLNCGLRLPYVFLPDVSRGLKLSTAETGRLLGLGELVGLSSGLIGKDLDHGRHRRWSIIGLVAAGLGAIVLAIFGVKWALLAGFAGISFGVSVYTTAGHSFLGDQIPVERRGRAIGLYETSWAVALLIGAPICALLIRTSSWVTPFAVIGIVVLACVPIVRMRMDARTDMRNLEKVAHSAGEGDAISWVAVASAVTCSILLTFGSVATFSSFSPWLEDRHGLRTGGLGAVAFGLGAMELLGSGGTAAFADRIGQRRSVAIGAAIMAVGSAILITGGATNKVTAVVGVLVLFGGFEFGYVSLLSVVSEVGGRKRGMVVAVDHSLVTITRAVGAGFGPWLAGKGSIHFSSVQTMAIVLALLSAVTILLGGSPSLTGAESAMYGDGP